MSTRSVLLVLLSAAAVVARGAVVVAAYGASAAPVPATAPGVSARPAVSRSGTSEVRPLTLTEAIEGALARDDSIAIERESLASAQAAIGGARGAYDPMLAVEAGWRSTTAPVNSAFSGAPEGEPAPTDRSTGASVSIEQLLVTGGRVSVVAGSSRATTDGAFAFVSPAYETRLGVELRQPLLRDRAIDDARLTIRVAAAGRDQARGALRSQVTETVAAVERAYWSLVATRRAVSVQEEAVDLASRQLDETRTRISSGAAPETEVAQPLAELERRRGDLLAAREAASRAETSLKGLILADRSDEWSVRLEPTETIAIAVSPVDAAAAMERALQSRPELEAAEAGVASRRIEAAYARDRIRPALDVVLSYDRYGLAGSRNPAGSEIPGLPGAVPTSLEGGLDDAVRQLGDGDFEDARISLRLAVPIGNHAARADAEIARSAEAQAAAGVSRLRKEIRTEVLNAAAATETAGARIEAARAAREAAEVQLSSEEDRFEVGLSTNFLVLTRQNDLAGARLAEIEAMADYRTARTELARATGSLLEEHRIALD